MILSDPQATDPILVVEGLNDRHVIRHLCERAEPALTFGIHDYQGIDNVINRIRAYANSPDRPAVGFVLDADDGPNQTWRRVSGQLMNAVPAIPLPIGPSPDGVIIPEDASSGNPRIGIWIMPDNVSLGELEKFRRADDPSQRPCVGPCPNSTSTTSRRNTANSPPTNPYAPRSTPGLRPAPTHGKWVLPSAPATSTPTSLFPKPSYAGSPASSTNLPPIPSVPRRSAPGPQPPPASAASPLA